MFANILKRKDLIHGIVKLPHNLYNFAKFRTSNPGSSKTKYGGKFTVTMVKADDFQPTMMPYITDIFQSASVPVEFEVVHLGHSEESLEAVAISIRRNGVAMKGSISTEYDKTMVVLRKKLGLFAHVLHCKSQLGVVTRHKDIDLVLIRQNTEGDYSFLEHGPASGVVESLRIVTRERTEEIARFAFQYASEENRKNITVVHKPDKMPVSDGLFVEVCREMAREYPAIEFSTKSVATCCLELLSKPETFDTLLLPNLYGNVMDYMASGLIGGAGLVFGQNYGHDCVLFETGCRSSVVLDNPVAMINASASLLRYLGLKCHAEIIEKSVYKTLNIDKVLTSDLGGKAQAADVVNHVIRLVKEASDYWAF